MLKRKFFRDLKNNKTQFVSIFLMVFLGVFIFSGISSYMEGMRVSAEKYYADYNFQDLWITGAGFSGQDLEAVKSIENVKNAERKFTVTGSLAEIENSAAQINFIESNEISKFYVIKGEGFNKIKDGVWMDGNWAKNNGLTPGQEITIKHENASIKKAILGLILVPDHVYDVESEAEIIPTHTGYGFVYLAASSFPSGEQNIPYNQIIVDVDDTAAISKTKANIEDRLENYYAVTDRSKDISHETYKAEMEEGNIYVGIFSGLFLFIAILSVVTAMNRLVRKQRKEIGLMKALGFKNCRITRLYLGYGLWISLIASILGMILGPLTIGLFFTSMISEMFAVPSIAPALVWTVFLVGALTVAVVSAVTYLSCRMQLMEKATALLKEKAPGIYDFKEAPGKGLFAKAGFALKWNWRDISRSKARTLMGVIGIMGCCALLVCAFGMLNTVDGHISWQFDDLYDFKYKLTLNETYTAEDLNGLVSAYGDNTAQTLEIEIRNGNAKETNTVIVDDANGMLKYTDGNRKYITLSNAGVYLTEKLADRLNAKAGGNIEWRVLGEAAFYTGTVAGINRNPQTQNMTMTREYSESLGIVYMPDSIFTNEDLSNVNTLSGVNLIQNKEAIRKNTESMMEIVRMMIVLIIAAAVVLGIIIVYNLGVLSLSEKAYQFATMKVLGFKTKRIRSIFAMQNLWITVVSVLLGSPLGFLITDFIFKNLSVSQNFDIVTKVNFTSYIIGIFGTAAVSLSVNRLLSRKVKTIDMVESLKKNE